MCPEQRICSKINVEGDRIQTIYLFSVENSNVDYAVFHTLIIICTINIILRC